MKNEFESSQIAEQEIKALAGLDNISAQDIFEGVKSVHKEETEVVDLKRDPKNLEVAISNIQKEIKDKVLPAEVGQRLLTALETQKTISENRPETFGKKVLTFPEKMVDKIHEAVEAADIKNTTLTGGGFGLILLNSTAACTTSFSSIVQFAHGNIGEGLAFLGLAGLNSAIGVFNYLTRRERIY